MAPTTDAPIAATAGPTTQETAVGIASLGLSFPSLTLPLTELATLRGEDPGKYLYGLGCNEMALCAPGEGVVDLATRAAQRALERWSGDPADIGLIAVGTESALDMSRPLSAWVAERLGLRGAVRSYEVKHACYGGTLALKQAVEWKLAGASHGKAALVIAADVALYALEDPGEPTQGAGAVAMVVDRPEVATIDALSYAWSEPAFDFWRPVGEDFPRVDGPFSLDCYKRAAEHCLGAWIDGRPAERALDELQALCFHVPFPKMVKKAFLHSAEALGLDDATAGDLFSRKVDPTMDWNRHCGNAYTASLWIAVASALSGMQPGQRLGAFSYGSGFGAELLTLTAGPAAADAPWVSDVETDFADRKTLDAGRYQDLRGVRMAKTA